MGLTRSKHQYLRSRVRCLRRQSPELLRPPAVMLGPVLVPRKKALFGPTLTTIPVPTRVYAKSRGPVRPCSSADEMCMCGHAIAGKFPTSMKNHLKRSHPKEYQLILSKEESLTKEKAMKKPKELQRKQSGQMTFQRKYDTQSSKYQMKTCRLAILWAAPILEALDP